MDGDGECVQIAVSVSVPFYISVGLFLSVSYSVSFFLSVCLSVSLLDNCRVRLSVFGWPWERGGPYL